MFTCVQLIQISNTTRWRAEQVRASAGSLASSSASETVREIAMRSDLNYADDLDQIAAEANRMLGEQS